MSVKYKIDNAKLNKKLVGDEVTVSKIKPRSPRELKGPKQPTLREMMVDIQNDNKSMMKAIVDLRNDFNRVIKLNNLKH